MQQPFIYNRGFVCMRCREDVLPARKGSAPAAPAAVASSPPKRPPRAASATLAAAGPERGSRQGSAAAVNGYAPPCFDRQRSS